MVAKVFSDPTPKAIIKSRILLRFASEIIPRTDLLEKEQGDVLKVLLLVARKMVSVWQHMQKYKEEEARLISVVASASPMQDNTTRLEYSQELFSEFDEFLVQIKSALDHLVKILVPVLGPSRWTIRTFANKGEDVLKALRRNLPKELQGKVDGFEKVVFDAHRLWLEDTITARDKINHFLDGEIPIENFAVFKNGEKITVPLWSPGQSISEFMDMAWLNLIHFVENFVAFSLYFKLPSDLALFHGVVPPDSPESPWKVTVMDANVHHDPRWNKL